MLRVRCGGRRRAAARSRAAAASASAVCSSTRCEDGAEESQGSWSCSQRLALVIELLSRMPRSAEVKPCCARASEPGLMLAMDGGAARAALPRHPADAGLGSAGGRQRPSVCPLLSSPGCCEVVLQISHDVQCAVCAAMRGSWCSLGACRAVPRCPSASRLGTAAEDTAARRRRCRCSAAPRDVRARLPHLASARGLRCLACDVLGAGCRTAGGWRMRTAQPAAAATMT